MRTVTLRFNEEDGDHAVAERSKLTGFRIVGKSIRAEYSDFRFQAELLGLGAGADPFEKIVYKGQETTLFAVVAPYTPSYRTVFQQRETTRVL